MAQKTDLNEKPAEPEYLTIPDALGMLASPIGAKEVAQQIDTNKDNKLSRQELAAWYAEVSEEVTLDEGKHPRPLSRTLQRIADDEEAYPDALLERRLKDGLQKPGTTKDREALVIDYAKAIMPRQMVNEGLKQGTELIQGALVLWQATGLLPDKEIESLNVGEEDPKEFRDAAKDLKKYDFTDVEVPDSADMARAIRDRPISTKPR